MISSKLSIIPTLLYIIASSCNSPQAAPANNNNPLDSIMQTVQTAPVILEQASESFRLNGKIQANEDHQAKVYALASGKIKSVNVALGDKVKQGQTLAVLQSMEVAGSSNDLSLAEANVAMTKNNLESTKDLYEGNLATSREYTTAQVDYNKALSINPNSYLSYSNRAIVKATLRRYREAVDDLNKAIELNPNFGDAYLNRGLCRVSLNDLNGGCLDLSKAGELGQLKAYQVIAQYCR